MYEARKEVYTKWHMTPHSKFSKFIGENDSVHIIGSRVLTTFSFTFFAVDFALECALIIAHTTPALIVENFARFSVLVGIGVNRR